MNAAIGAWEGTGVGTGGGPGWLFVGDLELRAQINAVESGTGMTVSAFGPRGMCREQLVWHRSVTELTAHELAAEVVEAVEGAIWRSGHRRSQIGTPAAASALLWAMAYLAISALDADLVLAKTPTPADHKRRFLPMGALS
jgi:hypothetical protein